MLKLLPDPVASAAIEKRRVVIVYENPSARERATRFCDELTQHHSAKAVLDIHWCGFAFLSDSASANDSANRAAAADWIVFALTGDGELPREIKLWIERWLGKRRDREGAIVGLVTERSDNDYDLASSKEVYLRHTATRAGMDYLSRATPAAWTAIPDSLDSYRQRAGQVTSVLDEILHTHTLPPPI